MIISPFHSNYFVAVWNRLTYPLALAWVPFLVEDVGIVHILYPQTQQSIGAALHANLPEWRIERNRLQRSLQLSCLWRFRSVREDELDCLQTPSLETYRSLTTSRNDPMPPSGRGCARLIWRAYRPSAYERGVLWPRSSARQNADAATLWDNICFRSVVLILPTLRGNDLVRNR